MTIRHPLGDDGPPRRDLRANCLAAGLWACVVVGVVVGVAASMKAWPIMIGGTGDNGRTALGVEAARARPSAPAPDPSTGATRGGAPVAPDTTRPVPPAGATSSTHPVDTFTAVSGEDCPATATSGFRRSGMSVEWYTRPQGGWTGDGCGGRVVAVPMSGDTATDDDDNVVVWWFTPPSVSDGACLLSVHVPDTGNPLDAAGAPAHYQAFASTDGAGAPTGEFDVDQTAHQGQWVAAARVPLTGGRLSIRMVTRGIDWGTGRDGAHLGVSALRATCQPTM